MFIGLYLALPREECFRRALDSTHRLSPPTMTTVTLNMAIIYCPSLFLRILGLTTAALVSMRRVDFCLGIVSSFGRTRQASELEFHARLSATSCKRPFAEATDTREHDMSSSL